MPHRDLRSMVPSLQPKLHHVVLVRFLEIAPVQRRSVSEADLDPESDNDDLGRFRAFPKGFTSKFSWMVAQSTS